MQDLDGILKHYGVLGMKWGVRKDKPSIKVTSLKDDVRSAKRKKRKKIGPKFTKKKEILDVKIAKEKLSDQKIVERLAQKPKSKKQLQVEKKYKDKGYNDREASIAAYHNIRTKRILAAAAAVTVTSAAAMGARYVYNDRVDKIIKSGTTIQRLTYNENEGIRDAFYAAFTKGDKSLYKAQFSKDTFAKELKSIKKMVPIQDIKQASPKKARDTFIEMYSKNKDFSDRVNQNIARLSTENNTPFKSMINKATKSAASGKADKNMYELFNIGLVLDDDKSKSLSKAFYKELSSKGYNALKDLNDSKKSIGFGAKNPTIFFNAKDKIKTASIKKLTEQEVEKDVFKVVAKTQGKAFAQQGAIIAGYVGGIKMTKRKIGEVSGDKVYKQYMKEHPGSNLSRTEIVDMYRRDKVKR